MNSGIKWIYRTGLFCIFMIAFMITPLPAAFANDGVMGFTPDGVYPVTQSDIMMKAEDISIDCMTGQVTCSFTFKNLGGAQTVVIGFPAMLDEYTVGLTSEEDISVRNFTARDEHGEIPVTLADTIPNPPLKEVNGMEKYKSWYIFSVDFDRNEEKTLYHTYHISFSYYSNGDMYAGYIIETGSLWKGSVGHSKITFDLGSIPMYAITSVYPNNFYRIEGNKLIFERSGFKPAYNLWISINQSMYLNPEWFDMYGGREKAQKRKELFSTSPENIRENGQKYFQMYKDLLLADPVSALYIKSALELPDGDEKPQITECRIAEHSKNSWRFDIDGSDPDGDLVSLRSEITGIEKFQFENDQTGQVQRNVGGKFQGIRLTLQQIKDNTPFSITFVITDAAGNSDTETLLLEAEVTQASLTPAPTIMPSVVPVIPEITPASTEIPEKTTISSGSDGSDDGMTASSSGKSPGKLFSMEEGTLLMLAFGAILLLAVSLGVMIVLYSKKKNKGPSE